MQTILTINGGSSSLKCALFLTDREHETALFVFKLGNIQATPRITISDGKGNLLDSPSADYASVPKAERHKAALETVLNWLKANSPNTKLTAFGHRVVHGGETFSHPVLINPEIRAELDRFIPLAPLHQPFNLLLIDACIALEPTLPQVACFDTMFHVGQPVVERHYAIPRKLTSEGVHRYGFHGLSYEYIHQQLSATSKDASNARTVICHLGAGASMCAIKEGRSIASSMGFTAVDGLPMGSRCGNIDPGVLLYLQRQHGMDADALEKLIYKESGLLGVSGISSDMLTLHQSEKPEANEAIEMFAYRIALEVGRLAAALQGLEQIVFTGGIGENDSDLRERVLTRCQWLGVRFNRQANDANNSLISAADSQVAIRVIATDEEAMIAHHVVEVIGG